jgi:hypothetical protein
MLILKHPRARRLVVLLSVALLAGCSERIAAPSAAARMPKLLLEGRKFGRAVGALVAHLRLPNVALALVD